MSDLVHDPRFATTLLVVAIWLTAWAAGLFMLRLGGARRISPSFAVLVPPLLACWLGWVWLR